MESMDFLILDHFLYSFHASAFEKLKPLCDILKHCEHTTVVRPDVSYEGVYLISQNGSYLELLLNTDDDPNIFALAISSISPQEGDVNELPRRFPTLNWATQQIFDSDNQPWHTYFGQAPIEEAVKQLVVLWAMQYQNLARHRPYQFRQTPQPKEHFGVREFVGTKLKIPKKALNIVKVQSQWLPGKHRIGTKTARLHIPTASQNMFEVTMESNENINESIPLSITMRLSAEADMESQELEGLRLTRRNDILIIDFLD